MFDWIDRIDWLGQMMLWMTIAVVLIILGVVFDYQWLYALWIIFGPIILEWAS